MATILLPAAIRERAAIIDLPTPAEAAGEMHLRRPLLHLLTIEPASFLNRNTSRAFRAAGYHLGAVRFWHQAIDWVQHGQVDAVLLDADAIDARVSATNVSTRRIVELLRRAAPEKALTIAVTSARDFMEIEDVLRAGVDVFVAARVSPVCLIQRIEAARARRHPRSLAHAA